jgi:hypothetical protein
VPATLVNPHEVLAVNRVPTLVLRTAIDVACYVYSGHTTTRYRYHEPSHQDVLQLFLSILSRSRRSPARKRERSVD